MLLEWLVTMKKKLSKRGESQREIDRRQDAKIERLAKEEIKDDKKIERLTKEVVKLKHRPVRIEAKFGRVKGKHKMPATLNVGQTITWTPSETDANGGNVPIVPANLLYSEDNSAVVSHVVDDNGVATYTGLSAGTAQTTVTDQKFNLSFTDVLTVAAVEQVPTNLTAVFGTPA